MNIRIFFALSLFFSKINTQPPEPPYRKTIKNLEVSLTIFGSADDAGKIVLGFLDIGSLLNLVKTSKEFRESIQRILSALRARHPKFYNGSFFSNAVYFQVRPQVRPQVKPDDYTDVKGLMRCYTLNDGSKEMEDIKKILERLELLRIDQIGLTKRSALRFLLNTLNSLIKAEETKIKEEKTKEGTKITIIKEPGTNRVIWNKIVEDLYQLPLIEVLRLSELSPSKLSPSELSLPELLRLLRSLPALETFYTTLSSDIFTASEEMFNLIGFKKLKIDLLAKIANIEGISDANVIFSVRYIIYSGISNDDGRPSSLVNEDIKHPKAIRILSDHNFEEQEHILQAVEYFLSLKEEDKARDLLFLYLNKFKDKFHEEYIFTAIQLLFRMNENHEAERLLFSYDFNNQHVMFYIGEFLIRINKYDQAEKFLFLCNFKREFGHFEVQQLRTITDVTKLFIRINKYDQARRFLLRYNPSRSLQKSLFNEYGFFMLEVLMKKYYDVEIGMIFELNNDCDIGLYVAKKYEKLMGKIFITKNNYGFFIGYQFRRVNFYLGRTNYGMAFGVSLNSSKFSLNWYY